MSTKSVTGILGACLLVASAVTASPIGDTYFMSGTNFPVNFPGSGPLTFNATGDTTKEPVVGSGAMGGIDVVEQIAGTTAAGNDILRFAFFFNQAPLDLNSGFAFTISGLAWGNGIPGGLEASSINVLFGSGNTMANVTMFTTVALLSDGLTISFATPAGISWNSFLTSTPTSLTVDFQSAVPTPEPSTVALLGLGLLAAARRRRRS